MQQSNLIKSVQSTGCSYSPAPSHMHSCLHNNKFHFQIFASKHHASNHALSATENKEKKYCSSVGLQVCNYYEETTFLNVHHVKFCLFGEAVKKEV